MPKIYRRGSYSITYWQRSNGRWRLTYRHPAGGRKAVERKTEPEIRLAAKQVVETVLAPGDVGSLDALPDATKSLVRQFLALGATPKLLDELRRIQTAQAKRSTKSLTDAVDEFLASKRDRGACHQEALKYQLGKLTSGFPGRLIADIETTELQAWLDALPLAPKSRLQIRGGVGSLFRWARAQGILEDRTTAAERLARPHIAPVTQPTYTPAQLAVILQECPEPYRPWIVLQAFCGLRYSEIFPSRGKEGIHWSDIRWDEGNIYVRRETSKTGHPRYACFPEVALEWLAGYPRDVIGPVCDLRPPHKEMITRQLGGLVGGWLRNGLRDSFISHRVPLVGYGQTAREAGNSEAMIRRHYDDPKSKSQGELWFNVRPGGEEKVIHLEKSC